MLFLATTLVTLFLFADTGATISAINDKHARDTYTISKRSTPFMCRVADGKYMKLQEYVDLPICNNKGEEQFKHKFFLIKKLIVNTSML